MRAIHAISAQNSKQSNQEEEQVAAKLCAATAPTQQTNSSRFIDCVCVWQHEAEYKSACHMGARIHSYALCYAHNFRLFAQECVSVCAHILKANDIATAVVCIHCTN